jgi:hypothetical protein
VRLVFIVVLLPALEANAIHLFVTGGYSHFDLILLCVTSGLYVAALANEIVLWTRPKQASADRRSREAMTPDGERG